MSAASFFHHRNQRGFTLLEIVVALAIVSISLMVMVKTVTDSVNLTDETTMRTMAYWVASNHASELQIAQQIPGDGTDLVTMGALKWRLKRVVTTTADPDVVKIVIDVADESGESDLVQFITYMARMDKPLVTSSQN